MKRLFFIFACIMIALTLSACAKSDEIIGEWIVDSYILDGEEIVSADKITDVFGSAFEVNNGRWIVFFDDGTFAMRHPASDYEYNEFYGDYSSAGSTIKLTVDTESMLLSFEDGMIYLPMSEMTTIRFVKSDTGVPHGNMATEQPIENYSCDLTQYSYVVADFFNMSMKDIINYEQEENGCLEYEESVGNVGVRLRFDDQKRWYTFRDGKLIEYFYIVNSIEFKSAMSEALKLFGDSDYEHQLVWNGNINNQASCIILTEYAPLENEYWVTISKVED